MMGAILSLVAVLLLVPMLSIVGSSTMATYLITSELCMASPLPTCQVLAMVLLLVTAVLLVRCTRSVALPVPQPAVI